MRSSWRWPVRAVKLPRKYEPSLSDDSDDSDEPVNNYGTVPTAAAAAAAAAAIAAEKEADAIVEEMEDWRRELEEQRQYTERQRLQSANHDIVGHD